MKLDYLRSNVNKCILGALLIYILGVTAWFYSTPEIIQYFRNEITKGDFWLRIILIYIPFMISGGVIATFASMFSKMTLWKKACIVIITSIISPPLIIAGFAAGFNNTAVNIALSLLAVMFAWGIINLFLYVSSQRFAQSKDDVQQRREQVNE